MPIVLDYTAEKIPVIASIIVDRCGILLNDTEHVRWETDELLGWINEGVGAIINMRPAAGSHISILPLMSGSQQALGDDVVQLLDVVRNIGSDGITPGRAITITDRALLDSVDPEWHSGAKKSTIYHYSYDDRLPRVFWVYPPAVAGTKVEIAYASLPESVDSVDDSVGIGMEYADALVNYVCFRAFAKESEFANGAIAATYYGAFQTALGIEVAGAQASSPNATRQ